MKTPGFLLYGLRYAHDIFLSLVRPVTPSVRIILVKEGKTLLIHHTYADKWYIPGGGVKRGETLAQCAAREAWEETGAVLRSEPQLLGIYYYQVLGRSDHVAVYASDDFDLAPPPASWEIAGRAWFALDNLPPNMNMASRARIAEYLADGGPYAASWMP